MKDRIMALKEREKEKGDGKTRVDRNGLRTGGRRRKVESRRGRYWKMRTERRRVIGLQEKEEEGGFIRTRIEA